MTLHLLAEEEKLKERIQSGIQKLDIFCQEVRESEDDLATFLSEYYGKVGDYIRSLEEVNKALMQRVDSRRQTLPMENEIPEQKAQQEYISPSIKAETSTPHLDQEMRELYLLLVKKFHPDTAPQGGDAELIKTITHAYQHRQMGSLWKVAFDQEWQEIRTLPSAVRLKLLQHYHARIHNAAHQMERRLSGLYASEEYQLRQRLFAARLRGEDLLERIVENLEHEVHRQSRRLEYLRIREQLEQEAS